MTREQAANELQCSKSLITYLVYRGRIAATKIIDNNGRAAWEIDADSVSQYKASKNNGN